MQSFQFLGALFGDFLEYEDIRILLIFFNPAGNIHHARIHIIDIILDNLHLPVTDSKLLLRRIGGAEFKNRSHQNQHSHRQMSVMFAPGIMNSEQNRPNGKLRIETSQEVKDIIILPQTGEGEGEAETAKK